MKISNLSLVISAPSGAGKTTLIKRLLTLDTGLEFVISTTTRPQRENEIEGESYYFTSCNEFQKNVVENKFIEWAKVHDNYYGVQKKEIDRIRDAGKIPVFDVDVQGAKNLKQSLHDAVFIFILPPSIEELAERLIRRRTDSDKQIRMRLETALHEIGEYHYYDYIVINDVMENAIHDLRSIIRAALLQKQRMAAYVQKMMEV
jgi:guanylate kinase